MNLKTKKTNKKIKSCPRKIVLVHKNKSKLRHFRLVEHRHTGKIIHHRHTSHLALVVILAIIGLFLYINDTAKAEIIPVSGSVSISALVLGPPPSIGATIISPKDGQKINNKDIYDISGTCQADTFVVVRNNNINAGSTVCDIDGQFAVQIELYVGENAISAMNYDNYNQAGPVTPTVTVYVTKKDKDTTVPITVIVTPEVPVVPNVPSIIPGSKTGLSSCDDYNVSGNFPVGGEPHIAIVCMPRLFLPGQSHTLGLIVWGGEPPYAVLIDWGNNSEDLLLSVAEPGYKTVSFGYIVPDVYKVTFNLKDVNGETSTFRASVQVGGSTTTIVNDVMTGSWLKTPVPIYLLAITITLGFWGGDLFDRQFGPNKKHSGRRKTA